MGVVTKLSGDGLEVMGGWFDDDENEYDDEWIEGKSKQRDRITGLPQSAVEATYITDAARVRKE